MNVVPFRPGDCRWLAATKRGGAVAGEGSRRRSWVRDLGSKVGEV